MLRAVGPLFATNMHFETSHAALIAVTTALVAVLP
jgi:hypothetical protein